MRRRPFRLPQFTVGLLAVAVVIAALTVVVVRTYPDAARRIALRAVSQMPSLAGPLSDISRSFAEQERQIRERWRVRVIDPVKGVFYRKSPASAPPDVASPWEGCLECHPAYATRPLFSVVYMPHAAHSENAIPCDRCHDAEGPGRDKVPRMEGCSGCHAVTGRTACPLCHPPGNIFHGAELAGHRDIGSKCYTCHTSRSLATRARSHDMPELDREMCASCHEIASFCRACHPPSHETGYTNAHADDLRSSRERHQTCWACHDSSWCAMRCHAGSRR